MLPRYCNSSLGKHNVSISMRHCLKSIFPPEEAILTPRLSRPLEANYHENDGYVAARLTIAEMLKSGTTCFLESMLTHGSGFDNVVKAVDESGIRACLVSSLRPMPHHSWNR